MKCFFSAETCQANLTYLTFTNAISSSIDLCVGLVEIDNCALSFAVKGLLCPGTLLL